MLFAECTWTSVRAFLEQRLCDRDGGFVAALTPRFCSSKSRFDFVSFKTKQPGESPFLRSQVQTVMQRRPVGPAAAYPLRETSPKQTPLYSLFPFPLVVELQPPPLSDTTLAERMPLRIPGTTITHSGP